MFSLHRTLSLRYLSRRWFRAGLIVASIMLGVATLVATQALSETMSKATLAVGNPMAGTIDLIITNGDFPIDRSLAQEIEAVPHVREAHAKIFGQADIIVGGKKIPVMVMGFDLTADEKKANGFEEQFKLSSDLDVVKISYATLKFARQTPCILGRELDMDLEKADLPSFLGYRMLEIEKNRKTHSLVSIASVEPKEKHGDWAAFGGYLVLLDLDAAAMVLGLAKGKVRRIDVALEPGTDPKKARAAIEKILRGRAEVRTMEEQNQSLQSATSE